MNVLIVAKTRMSSGYCVGGLVLENNRSVRLLPVNGHNQPRSTQFEVGQIWDLSLQKVNDAKSPHTEDVRVLNQRYMRSVSNLSELLQGRVKIFSSTPHELFDGLIQFTGNGSGYISHTKGVCEYSTGFWKPERQLILTDDEGKVRYLYRHPYLNFRISYVGLDEAVETIEPNTLLRLSLARWWKPDNVDIEERCYLQLSGWYK